MVNQTDIARLHQRIDETKDVLSGHIQGVRDSMATELQGVKDAMAELGAVVRESVSLCNRCRPKVLGNGKDGFDIRVDRLEQWKVRFQLAITSIVLPLIVYGGYVFLQAVFLQK